MIIVNGSNINDFVLRALPFAIHNNLQLQFLKNTHNKQTFL